MTKKHFVAMAKIVKDIKSGQRGPGNHNYQRAVDTAEVFIELAKQFNPQFDTAKFMKACGLVP